MRDVSLVLVPIGKCTATYLKPRLVSRVGPQGRLLYGPSPMLSHNYWSKRPTHSRQNFSMTNQKAVLAPELQPLPPIISSCSGLSFEYAPVILGQQAGPTTRGRTPALLTYQLLITRL